MIKTLDDLRVKILELYSQEENKELQGCVDSLNSTVEFLGKGINEKYWLYASVLEKRIEEVEKAVNYGSIEQIRKVKRDYEKDLKRAKDGIQSATSTFSGHIDRCIQNAFQIGRIVGQYEFQENLSCEERKDTRKMQVIEMLKDGMTTAEIAEKLGVSRHTAEGYVRIAKKSMRGFKFPNRESTMEKVERLTKKGLLKEEIAAELHLTHSTVDTYQSKIRVKNRKKKA